MNRSVKVAWPGISRWILLVVFGPLFGFALWYVTRFDAKKVTGMAFSRDGRELMVFRGVEDPKSRKLNDASCTIQVWNVASRRLSRSQITGHGKVEATRDGEHLLDVSQQGRIRILSPATFQPLFEWQLPETCGKISHVSRTDRLLVVDSVTENKTAQITCLDLHDGRIAMQWSGGSVFHALSRDGRRLFVSIGDATAKTWQTQTCNVEGAAITPLQGKSFDGRTFRADSAGNVVFLTSSGAKALLKIRDVRAGSEYEWKPPARLGSPWGLFFTDDGTLRVIHDFEGPIATYDVTSGEFIGEQRLAGASSMLLEHAVSPDERFIAGTTDYWRVHIWDLATGRMVARLPDQRVIHYGLAIAFGIWGVAWVAVGARLNQPHPWLDVILINGLLVSIMISYAAVRPFRAIDPVAIVVCFAILTALVGMLTVWWIHGGVRWSLRLAGLFGGLGVIAVVVLIALHRSDSAIWDIMLGTVSFVGGLALLMYVWRCCGFAISRDTLATTNSASGNPRWQIPLRDTLILTAAIALLLGVMRFVVPGARPMHALAQVSVLGTAFAVVVFVATWAALSSRGLVVRWGLSGLVVPLTGALAVWFCFGPRSDVMQWWYEITYVLTALTILLSLTVFRLHGYRLKRVS